MCAARASGQVAQNAVPQTLVKRHFGQIDLDDPFFDSLKNDYKKFAVWFQKKAHAEAFVFLNQSGSGLDGFLYLKEEEGSVEDVSPHLPSARRLKIGTFKINPHGTRLGERFMKRAFDTAIDLGVAGLYVTIFAKHEALVQLFEKYGFVRVGSKSSEDGIELVLERQLNDIKHDVVLDYPRIPFQRGRHFVLSIYPAWHSRLLPDSLLRTESSSILQDVSHTNSIHKIYLTGMSGVDELGKGDTLIHSRHSG